ncbi:hypothetical protein Desaf_2939 [Desulfocurvibacter africanus subsp. africanus str. Walvis Bay]|uniref:Uncharacterized protein n=1 Tax=Desulfocurvibacter africanus subsp. africanus str. Walvis Bay TaxID=690850 RepID=F3Z238_DESAF|nr:hypothetical protein Desaf_2939 [Desulfocurvibacter africanus subsp. africanus str. Walvis Bay]
MTSTLLLLTVLTSLFVLNVFVGGYPIPCHERGRAWGNWTGRRRNHKSQ